MRTVLVLGGNGFIGRNLLAVLQKKGFDVYNFDLHEPEEKLPGVTYLSGDFFDNYVLEQAIEGKDLIYHAICTLNPGNSNHKYVMGYERDLLQTMRLCNMLRGTDTRMVFLSSGGTVYGRQERQPIMEDALPSPINHYGNLKLCIENTLRVFRYQEHADYVIARISNPYGPGQDYRKGVGFIDAVMKHALTQTPVEVWGSGDVVRDYIYIDDVCEALAFLGEADIPYAEVNISSGRGASQNEIIEMVRRHFPDLRVEYRPARSVDADRVVLSNRRLGELFPKALVSLEEGIERYYRFLCHLTRDLDE